MSTNNKHVSVTAGELKFQSLYYNIQLRLFVINFFNHTHAVFTFTVHYTKYILMSARMINSPKSEEFSYKQRKLDEVDLDLDHTFQQYTRINI